MMKIINTAIVIMALGIMATLTCGLGKTISAGEIHTVKVSYTVKCNDTYWEIAERNYNKQDRYQDIREFVDAIRRSNDYKTLVPGMVIEFPLESRK